ncbi:MAG TPA: PhnD/SsuA/transferrin family substrate-binding protein [Acidiferrobacterales bacterium]|nr:PhnD/SsuA/transferrin family substrate-binding protein [Acidiferrobacterales bacterium]
MRSVTIRSWLFFIIMLLGSLPVQAELILSSAPRDTKEKEEEIYKPIADLLSKATGEKVTFRYGDNFLVYQSEMRKGSYDIVLDGPAFVGWRMAKLGHVPLVKFPGNLVFVAITKTNQDKIKDLKDLAGRTVCSFPPPNLSALTVLYEFDNPSRQPLILEVQTFPEAYKGVVSGKCVGGILQAKLYQDLDKEAKATKVLFTSNPLPNQAFSAGPRLAAEKREQVIKALLSPEGAAATQKLRDVFKVQALAPATVEEFQGLGKLMRDVWGFEL